MSQSGRREFIKRTATAAALFTVIPRHLLGGRDYTPPSDQITKGVIGVGEMGRMHFGYEGTRLIACCDADKRQLESARPLIPRETVLYNDFRELLQRSDIDVVHIATPPHWHGVMASMAAAAGKDIWCETPMTLTMGEGREVADAVKRHGRVFRLNTSARYRGALANTGTTARQLKRIAESGILGWPLTVTLNQYTGFDLSFKNIGRHNLKPETVPPGLNYDMWVGPAPFKPYNQMRLHTHYRAYWDFGGGDLGDAGQHYLDPVQYILGKDDMLPVRTESESPPQHHDAAGKWQRITYIYDDGCRIILDADNRDREAALMEGPEGKLFKDMRSDIPSFNVKVNSMPEPVQQVTTFLESVKSRQPFAINEQNGSHSSALVSMGIISLRLGRDIEYNADDGMFKDTDAERLASAAPRMPWRL
jgi:myo-inositol 2-dehydrogenase / D-chiro-inositol 1-dehydrogenase